MADANFDEAFYLDAYPDVQVAVARGELASGRAHFDRHGRAEGRISTPSQMPEGKVPVAFFIFNRPSPTALTFAKIREYQPDTLLLIADGPRHGEEARLVDQTRAVVEKIDWPCRVLRNFSEENLGCRQRVAGGLQWVFEQVESAAILEDDCLPHSDFFTFCHMALHRYRDDPRVMHVSGSTFVKPPGCHTSWWFSRHSDIWGWATWRRAFAKYDVSMSRWKTERRFPWISWLGDTDLERRYWRSAFDEVAGGRVDTWDYQWHHTVYRHHGLAVVPEQNLITNIGHGAGATHTNNTGVGVDLQATSALGPWRIPGKIQRDADTDTLFFVRRYALPATAPIGKISEFPRNEPQI